MKSHSIISTPAFQCYPASRRIIPRTASGSLNRIHGPRCQSPLQLPSLLRAFPESAVNPHRQSSLFPPRRTTSTTQLQATGAIESAALGFFSGIRIPAALIAGSSLSTFFSMTKTNITPTSSPLEKKWQDRLVFTYHALSFISLLLSLNVVITATAAGTTLLLDTYDSVAVSAFEFLKGEMYYELMTTRWSFFVSLLCFLGSVTTRAFIEFDLLKPKRRKLGKVLLLSVGAFVTHLISFINSCLYTSPNLLIMTWEVIKISISRAVTERGPLEILSVILTIIAIAVGVSIVSEDKNRGSNDDFKAALKLALQSSTNRTEKAWHVVRGWWFSIWH